MSNSFVFTFGYDGTTDVSRNPVNVTNGYFEILVPSLDDDISLTIFEHIISCLNNLSNLRCFVVFRNDDVSDSDCFSYVCCYVLDDCKQRRRLSPFKKMLLGSFDFEISCISFCSKSALIDRILILLSSPKYTFIKKLELSACP